MALQRLLARGGRRVDLRRRARRNRLRIESLLASGRDRLRVERLRIAHSGRVGRRLQRAPMLYSR